MTITIHRGKDQIGGCVTEIATEGAKILIDFGSNLPGTGKPDFTDDDIARITKDVDAVFYTHYHGDHIGSMHRIPKSIPQYMGEGALEVCKVKTHALAKVSDEAKSQLPLLNKIITYRAGSQITIANKIKLAPYFVSHSAFDSYMFLIECEGKRILHTGDFREHGYLGKGLLDTIRKYIIKEPVDILITEGTMLGRTQEKVEHEATISSRAYRLLTRKKGTHYFFALCSSTDIDRLASFHSVCKKTGAGFVCDSYQINVLKVFSQYAGKKSNLYLFDHVCERNNRTSYFHLENISKGFIMPIRANKYQLPLVQKVLERFPNAELIYSMWQGYYKGTEEQQNPDIINLRNLFGDERIHELHTSGHATRETLAKVCNLVNPQTAIIPIHKEAKTDYSTIDISDELKLKIVTHSTTIDNITFVL